MAPPPWDYLVVTASDERQAASCESQLALRRRLGFLAGVRTTLAVPDPGGARIGSGGSTVWALLKVLGKEAEGRAGLSLDPRSWVAPLSKLRVLIVHAGGDSRRLPAYAHCGKLFIPVPGTSDRVPGPALLDRLLPVYLGLPALPEGRGQVVVTTGDVLLAFDPGSVAFADEGVTGLGSFETPELAAGHGVFCPGEGGSVLRFLQKPSPAEQAAMGALDGRGRSVLDIGVMSFDARTAVALIRLFEVGRDVSGGLTWRGPMAAAVERSGLDFYREICCAMGTEASAGEYRSSVRRAGSALGDALLDRTFDRVSRIPFHVFPLRKCGFLHFGTPRQLIRSGRALVGEEGAATGRTSLLSMNNDISNGGAVRGGDSWVEGCRVRAPLDVAGGNVVTGVDVLEPLSLPPGAVLDIVEGRGRDGRQAFFVRAYGIDDVLALPLAAGAKLAGLPLPEWLDVMGASPDDVWDPGTPADSRLAWNGRIFPRTRGPEGYRKWLWMLDPKAATEGQKSAWKAADRYSLFEMARLASPEAFHARRHRHRALELARLGERIFRPEGETSAVELSFVLERLEEGERREGLSGLLAGAFLRFGGRPASGSRGLGLARALHTLGTAVSPGPGRRPRGWDRTLSGCFKEMPAPERAWFEALGLSRTEFVTSTRWAAAAKDAAFDTVGKAIVGSRPKRLGNPRCAVKLGEAVSGRAPVRLDLGGGWTDTPPYSLERGGAVINAAVDLDGGAPVLVQARVISEPVLRLRSIDHRASAVVRDLDDLLDYRRPGTAFGLAKAAIALAGFSPEAAVWPRGARSLERMLELFGGGIELATYAAVPSGSGLGTSSIMGAALIAVLHRLAGRRVSTRSLFHDVLRLEQELTTGGGWQDQVGGVVGGVKVIEADPGLVPNPRVRYVPSGLLDPARNGGTTLLYYTGIRRLAKGILRGVVGNVLDRDRRTMDTLAELRAFPSSMEAAMRRGDASEFGALIDLAWRLNKRIDPESTTPVIEEVLSAVRPRVWGAKLLGAGGGGFLLMACRSAANARAVRRILAANPPNDKARFFDYSVNGEGLVVTVG